MKLLVLLSRVPYPIEKGDKLRAYHQIKYLSKKNEIILCALNDSKPDTSSIKHLEQFCSKIYTFRLSRIPILFNIFLAFLNGKPLQVGYFYRRKIKKQIKEIVLQEKPDHIFCQLLRVVEYVKDISIPKTLDYQDVFSKGVERRIATSPFYMKPILKLEYKRLLKYERKAFSYFDHHSIISKPDRDLIPHPDRDKIAIVPNGVDHDFFRPMSVPSAYDLVFIGNMGYPPNVNAAVYIVKKIAPLVKERKPDLKIMIAGATPHPSVVSLRSSGVEVTGWVDDIRSCYARARIFIAPMQIGTGLQNKLLEAMSMKIPSITSPMANDALGAKEGEEIIVCSSPGEYADQIIYLLENPEKSAELAEKGYRFVKNRFNWDTTTRILEQMMER